MSSKAHVQALLALINAAAGEAMAEYERYGKEVPSLDSTDPHPLDNAEDVLQLRKTIRVLEGACEQLCATLAPPALTVVNRGQNLDWVGLRVATKAKIADALADHQQGLHVDELSKVVKIEPGKLTRIVRLLATKNIFREVQNNVFANNRLSSVLISSNSISNLVYCNTILGPIAATVFYQNLTDPTYASSYEPTKAAFMQAVQSEGTETVFYDWLKAHPELRAVFGKAMIGLGQVMGSLAVLHHFPWRNFSTLCDVGSGVGGFSLPLAKANPSIKVTLLDRPETIAQAEKLWAEKYPAAIETQQVQFINADFFENVPVEGQDIYYLRNIVHNWPDAQATLILRNVRKAMGPKSRVFLHEYVLGSLNRTTSISAGDEKAPDPMLPNFGAGVIRAHYQDLRMLFLYNSKERTLDEFIELGATAGLRFERVWDMAEASMLEFTLLDEESSE